MEPLLNGISTLKDFVYFEGAVIAAVVYTLPKFCCCPSLLTCMASLDSTSHEELCLQALAVALKHPAVAADQRNICTLLKVNKAWRTAVQQSAASLTDIKFHKLITSNISSTFVAFTRWLLKHPGLICSLSIMPQFAASAQPADAPEAALQHLLELVIQVASLPTATVKEQPASAEAEGIPAAATPASIAHSTALSQLKLRSYSSSIPPTAELLAALPAATLTRLAPIRVDNSNWCSYISQLTNLQQITVDIGTVKPQVAATTGFLQAINSLNQLTKLQISNMAIGCDTRVFPVQLQELRVMYALGSLPAKNPPQPADGQIAVDLQHLTQLQVLSLMVLGELARLAVPPNLFSLQLTVPDWPAGGLSSLSSLTKVTSVELDIKRLGSQHIGPFTQLTHLKDLTLRLGEKTDFGKVVNSWGSLPLHGQGVSVVPQVPHSSFMQLMQHISAATMLTSLAIILGDTVLDYHGGAELAVCKHLTTLTQLHNLMISPGRTQCLDAQLLSTLVTLTSLYLGDPKNSELCIDTTTLCLLALKLSGLEKLGVWCRNACVDEVGTTSAVLAIGGLTSLRALDLGTLPAEAAQQGLQMLTDLCRLTCLKGFDKAGKKALQAFWDRIQERNKRLQPY